MSRAGDVALSNKRCLHNYNPTPAIATSLLSHKNHAKRRCLKGDTKKRDVGFYIPQSVEPGDILIFLTNQIEDFLKMDDGNEISSKTFEGLDECTNRDLIFSNEVYVFSESTFDTKAIYIPKLNITYFFS